MSKKLLAGIVAVVVLALAVWLVPTAVSLRAFPWPSKPEPKLAPSLPTHESRLLWARQESWISMSSTSPWIFVFT